MNTKEPIQGVYPIHLSDGKTEFWCVAARDGDTLLLVDCGMPWLLKELETAVQVTGLTLDALRYIILTHQDYDHTGNLSALKDRCPQLQVLCGRLEEPYINGKRTALHLLRMEAQYKTTPTQAILDEIEVMRSQRPTPVNQTLAEGDRLDMCGGIRVIDTPGHTPGHISVYFDVFDILVSGDALRVDDGQLVGANPAYTYDMAQANESLRHFVGLNPRITVCAHGGIFVGDTATALNALSYG